MDKTRIKSALALMAFILQFYTEVIEADPDLLPEEFCTVREHGLFPHPVDCSKFVICTYGRAIAQACAAGMLFDAQINACNYAHSTTCGHSRKIIDEDQQLNPYLYQPPGYSKASHTAKYFYGDNRMDVVYEPNSGQSPMQKYEKQAPLNSRELHRKGSNSDHYYYDYYDGSNYHGRPSSDSVLGDGYQTRQGMGDGYQTRQSYPQPIYGEGYSQHIGEEYQRDHNTDQHQSHHNQHLEYRVDSKEHTAEYPEHVDSMHDQYGYEENMHENPRKEDRDRYLIPDPDPQELERIRNEEEPDTMFHYVHTDTVDPNIFKRIRGPGEDFHEAFDAVDGYDVGGCVNRADGLYPDPRECTRYIQCANDIPYRKQCPTGTFFSPIAGTCGYGEEHCRRDRGRFVDKDISDTSGTRISAKEDHGPRFFTEETKLARIQEFMTNSLIESKVNALAILQQQVEAARKMKVVSRPFTSVASFLGSTPYVLQLSMPAFLQLECLRMIKDNFRLDKDEMTTVIDELGSALPINPFKVAADMNYPIPTMSACPFPNNDENNNCDPNAPFRTFDGSCNNLKRPLWGKSFRALGRFLEADYCDGIGELRCAKSGRKLPSARAVSSVMFAPDVTQASAVHTVMHMTFGQFLAHDNERTAVTKLSMTEDGSGDMVDVMCGDDGCSTRGPENRACEPIPVPARDPDFTNKSCLMFVRTQEVMRDDCRLAPRDQLNQLTAWFDASVIYGSTKNESDALRDLTTKDRGRLKTITHPINSAYRNLLPQKENKDCRDLNSTIQCFNAGDGRVNEQIGLISMHTIFHRGHNTLEAHLHYINPHWSGERLFQETRKLMAAIWQYIVYNEYVPLVLGPAHTRIFRLQLEKEGYWDGYDDGTNPDIKNAFATAAFRFGHSQIGDVIRLVGQMSKRQREIDFSTVLRRPLTVYEVNQPAGSAIDSIMLGMASQAAEKVDTHFSKEITVRLFSEDPPREPGLDLPALNIHRGRDHGIPAYNRWREWCGLPMARDFYDMGDVPYANREQFSQLYESVDDVDLYAAGVVEEHVAGGVVGPTFACIIATQFRDLRVGDRFWHEREDIHHGFTPEQLQEIRKMTFARIICDNTDYVDTIQKFVMLQPINEAFRRLGTHNYREAYSLASLYHGEDNERRPCTQIPQMDLSKWRERPY